ncbi:MAG: hypothetical protein R3F14_46045, partial [Polyangiaceae bacterium]
NDDNFALNQPDQWIQALGANAGATASFSVGVFSLSYDVAAASVLYRRDDPSVAFSATYDPSLPGSSLSGLPFNLKGSSAHLAGYVTNSASQSFFDVDGDLLFGTAQTPKFAKQTITGKAHLTGNGATFSGKAKFAGTTVNVSGSVYKTYAAFSGSIDHNWGVQISGVGVNLKTTLTTSFDSRGSAVSLSATAQVCGNVPGVLGGCDSIGIKELSVTSSGHLRICVNVPVEGEKCDTLD